MQQEELIRITYAIKINKEATKQRLKICKIEKIEHLKIQNTRLTKADNNTKSRSTFTKAVLCNKCSK